MNPNFLNVRTMGTVQVQFASFDKNFLTGPCNFASGVTIEQGRFCRVSIHNNRTAVVEKIMSGCQNVL